MGRSPTSSYEHHRKLYGEIEESLSGLLKAGNSGDWSGFSAKLYRQAVALHAVMENHIDKENELLLPIYYENFSEEELKGLMAKMGEEADQAPQELLMRMLPWMFNANSVDDREGMLRGFKEMVPPQMFVGMTQFLAG
jgi:iron-sulfur cluster repair protein YtfE (RIC family)